MRDGWLVVAAIAIFAGGLFFGFFIGQTQIQDDCRHFGKFYWNLSSYTCQEAMK